ncbi:MAG TPA: Ig-like domain-containing protein [Gemmatimonadaceae bacterium]|nr:Ig-like domain-containing protein [Gemmatimonadaceae bacterium]
MRRRLIAASIFVAACASAGPPPGGPEDRSPPRLVRVTPDTNAVNVGARAATFYFDETINDRGTGQQDLGSLFIVSPSDGTPRVSYHRTRIDVRPRHGFRPNTAYTVTLLPGLGDLRGNTMKSGAAVVFSTGATIPTVRINGVAFDWVAERGAANALVEAVTPDSVVYIAQADSSGRFSIGPLVPGTYLVRGTIDQNNNRTQDRTESWDSVRVTAPQSAPVELLAAPRDTLPARLTSVIPSDSVTLRLTFDRLLDPAQQFPATNFRVAGADSVSILLTTTSTPQQEAAAQRARSQQASDSARRADSVAGRPRPVQPPTPVVGAAPADSAAKPSRPAPFNSITLGLARPLAPSATYRVTVKSVRALSRRESGSERTFTTPKPAPARPATDSTAPPAARPPAAAPRGAAPPSRQ